MPIRADVAPSALTCDASCRCAEAGDHESGDDNPACGLGPGHSRLRFEAVLTVWSASPHDHIP